MALKTHISTSLTHFGEDSLVDLDKLLTSGGHESILIVSGRDFLDKCGVTRLLKPILKSKKTCRVSDFETNPKKQDLEAVLAQTEDFDYSIILAIGGGSALDMAKLIKCFKNQPATIDEVIHGERQADPSEVELLAIPTTAGSGSEATHFAVLYDNGVKYSVAHENLAPRAAWILPTVLKSVPNDIAAASALDAFCQAVESYWCIHSTEISQKIAKEAIVISWENMLPAVLKKEPLALAKMGKASNLAGKAINITKTTAPHAVSYALTAHFNLLHGHAVALMLPSIYRYNAGVSEDDVLDLRGADYVKKKLMEIACAIGHTSIEGAANAISKRVNELNLSTCLSELGISSLADREKVIRNGFNPGRVNNNPRKLTEMSLRLIIEKMD